jgi:anti-anti-sigma factor
MEKNMNVTVSQKNDLMIVAVEGRLDTVGSRELEHWVDQTFTPPESNVTMDFSHLDYISSAGLRSILNMSKLLNKYSYNFSICSAQDHVREVLEISGFDSFIPLYVSVEECLS